MRHGVCQLACPGGRRPLSMVRLARAFSLSWRNAFEGGGEAAGRGAGVISSRYSWRRLNGLSPEILACLDGRLIVQYARRRCP